MTEAIVDHFAGHYGWRPDLPDFQDFTYTVLSSGPLPNAVDLRPTCPPVYDQGQLGSCTSNAIAGALEFEHLKAGDVGVITPSRLFIYYNERVLEHSVSQDAGAYIRDGMKTVAKQGACPETEWPYDIHKFATKPPAKAFTDAKKYKVLKYSRVSRALSQMKGCLADGNPFVFGFTVYESFESETVATTGIVPMPVHGEAVLGGHAVLAVGYDSVKGVFIVRNSWGESWGMSGYFTMPFAYFLNSGLSSDFWQVTAVM